MKRVKIMKKQFANQHIRDYTLKEAIHSHAFEIVDQHCENISKRK